MKIKLSKSQWEEMGKQAGWIKMADIDGDFRYIYNLLYPMITLLKEAGVDISERWDYGIAYNNPQNFENDEYMLKEIEKAKQVLASYVKFVKSINWSEIEQAEQAIESLQSQYEHSLLS